MGDETHVHLFLPVVVRSAKQRRDDDEIELPNKRSKLEDGSHLLNELGAHINGTASKSTSTKRDGSPLSSDSSYRVNDAASEPASSNKNGGSHISSDSGTHLNSTAGESASPNKSDGSHLPSDVGIRIDGTRSSGGSFLESSWSFATTPTERHYIIQNKRCDSIKPHTNEHWIVNGPIQKCTSCSAKAVGGGSCRFEGLRAFAAVLVGEELKSFIYDNRIHDTPQTCSTMTVTDTRHSKKTLPKNFKSSLTGFKSGEQPDFRDWVLRGRPDDFERLSVSDLAASKVYPHGISEAASRIETASRNLAKSGDSDVVKDDVAMPARILSKANHTAFNILRLTAPTLHKALGRIAPHFTRQDVGDVSRSLIIFRSPVPGERVTCDSCGTTCFLGSWMCVLCGREKCVDCWDSWHSEPGLFIPRLDKCANRKRHTRKHFYMISRTSVAEINWLLCRTSPKAWTLVQEEALQLLPPNRTLGLAQTEEGQIPVDLLASFREFVFQNNSDPVLGKSVGSLTGLSLPETFSYRGHPSASDTHISFLKNSRPLLPTFEAKDLSSETFPLTDCLFSEIWHLQGDRRRGMPIVISGMLSRFDMAWIPDYFINNYGDEQCWVVNCSTNETLYGGETVTVGEFFQSFETHIFRGETASMKLKDWPPHDDFSVHFPELFQDFQKALPFPDRMSRGGFANLASHFPKELLQPDLGPKMYCAYPAPEFFDNFSGEEKGSTRLHLDVTCAINIMVYAAPATTDRETPSPPGAIWDIFEPGDTGTLNRYLRQKYPRMGVDDPVNRQLFYLSSNDLSALNTEKWGYTKSFRVLQEPGDAVLIPAGCAHQVANGRSSIKVAVDFVAAERIHVCEDVMAMFRDMAAQYKYPICDDDVGSGKEGSRTKAKRLTGKNRRRVPAAPVLTRTSLGMKEDILQLYNCLYLMYFQIRGLNLSINLGSYGHGLSGVNAIFGREFPSWQEVTVKRLVGVAEKEEGTLEMPKGAEGVQLPEEAKAAEIEDAPP